MIITVRTIQPALGKEAELRAVLTEWVRTRQTEGSESTLLRRIYNSEPPSFIVSSRYPDLAAMDEGRKRLTASESFRRYQERQQGLLAAPTGVRVYSVILAPRRADESAPPAMQAGGLVATWTWRPAGGRAGEAQRALKEYTEILQGQGQRMGLRNRILSDEGAELVGTALYGSMAEHQAFRESALPSEEFRSFMQRINPLLGAPTINRFGEILVPFSSR